jgi:hypothetical protein
MEFRAGRAAAAQKRREQGCSGVETGRSFTTEGGQTTLQGMEGGSCIQIHGSFTGDSNKCVISNSVSAELFDLLISRIFYSFART